MEADEVSDKPIHATARYVAHCHDVIKVHSNALQFSKSIKETRMRGALGIPLSRH